MCEEYNWFLKLIPHLSEAQIKVCDALIQYGREECCFSTGEPCWTLRVSLRVLAADAGIGRASAHTASLELRGMSLLYISTATTKTGIHGYQLRKSPPRKLLEGIIRSRGSPKFILGKQLVSLKNRLPPNNPRVGDDDILPEAESVIDSSTSPPPGDAASLNFRLAEVDADSASLKNRLAEIGFTQAESFVAANPADRIEAALALVEASNELNNPAGFLRRLVESGETIPVPLSQRRVLLEVSAPDPKRTQGLLERLEKVLEEDPGNPAAKFNLERLKSELSKVVKR